MPGAYTINFHDLTARGFKDTSAANYFATGGEDVVARDVGVAETLATTEKLSQLLRKLDPTAKVPGTRAELAKAIWVTLEAKVEVDATKVAPPPISRYFVPTLGKEVSNSDRDTPKATGPRPAAAPKPPRQPGAAPVRTTVGGQFIYPTTKCGGRNPRREGTHGWKSMKIILDSPGITTAEYFRQGGRPNDLKWDIEHGNVEVVKDQRP